MPNMSYCRFENTYSDLLDCYDALMEMENDSTLKEDMSDYEREAMKDLIDMCKTIGREFDND